MDNLNNHASNEKADEQEKQSISEAVQANVEMEREFYEGDDQSVGNYYLSDTSRNGS